MMGKIRVGLGFDVHRLVEGRELWLGGIRLEHSMGLLGHSDADVLIHAICDALLGAANMRDIGYHFPDTGEEFRDIDSKILLRKTEELIGTKGYRVGNVDATVCAERPKLKPHIPAMQVCLAEVMGIDADDVSVKATTTEKLGFTWEAKRYGNTYEYRPLIEETEYKRTFLGGVVTNYFANSYKEMVSFFAKDQKISTDDLKDIIDLIEKGKE